MSRRLLIVPMASVFAGLLAGKSDGSPSRNDTHGGSSRMHAGLPPSNATVAPPLLLFVPVPAVTASSASSRVEFAAVAPAEAEGMVGGV